MKPSELTFSISFALVSIFCGQPVYASTLSDSMPKIQLHYQLALNGNYSRNKVEQFLISSNNSLTLQRGAFGISQALTYQYSLLRSPLTAPRINLLNETQLSTKFYYRAGKLEPLAILGYEKSNYRAILGRYFAIVGVDYKLIDTRYNHFSPLLGISTEFASYKDDTEYNNRFLCFGLRGLHELPKNKFRLQYNGYFFRRIDEKRWRYQGAVTAMIQVIKPLYATANFTFSEEKVISSDQFRKNTVVTFGITYRK